MNRSLLVLLGLVLLISTASADVGLTVTPSGEAWVEEMVTVTSSCDSGSNVYGRISGPMIANLPPFSYDSNWSTSFYPSLLLNTVDGGSYVVNVTCEKGGSISETAPLTLYGLFITPDSPKTNELKVGYPGEDLKITFNFSRDSSPVTTADFKVKLGNTVIFNSESGDIPVFNSNTKFWEINAKIPEYASVGVYDLTIEAKYRDHTLSKVIYNAVEVRSALDVNIIEPLSLYPYRLSESRDVPVVLTIKYKSNPVSSLDVQGFVAKLEDQDLLIKEIKHSPSNWSLLVNIPEFTPRKDVYNLDIYVNYKGTLVKSRNSLPIQFLMRFEGFLIDASGTPVSGAEIKLRGDGTEERSVTDTAGNYSIVISPGIYDMELYMPKIRAKITGVNLNSSDLYLNPGYDLIKYDYSSDALIDGMTVAELVALELDMGFDKAYIEMPYSDSKIANEEDITVLACHEWNFGRRTCVGNWEKVDSNVNTVRNLVSFEVDKLSAFVITEGESLVIDASFDKSSYKPGETVVITGKVTSSRGNVVKSARVNYRVEKTGEEDYTTTDSSGSFTIRVKAPSDTGIFDLKLNAEKSSYISVNTTLSREVLEEKDLTITADSSLDLTTDEEKSMTFKVSNTGDVDLHSLDISVEGVPSEWYALSRTVIDELGTGEEREVTLTFAVPKDYCSNHECKSSYDVTIRADADEASGSKTFTLKILGLEKPSGITGFFTFDTVSTAVAVAVLLVVILFLEKKRRGGKFPKPNLRYQFRPRSKQSRVLFVDKLNRIKSEIVEK